MCIYNIYIYLFIYLYYIKFTYVFSSTISGLLNFLPVVNKRAIMQQVLGFCFVLSLVFCVSFLLFLGWVFIYACIITEQRAEGCSGVGGSSI